MNYFLNPEDFYIDDNDAIFALNDGFPFVQKIPVVKNQVCRLNPLMFPPPNYRHDFIQPKDALLARLQGNRASCKSCKRMLIDGIPQRPAFVGANYCFSCDSAYQKKSRAQKKRRKKHDE